MKDIDSDSRRDGGWVGYLTSLRSLRYELTRLGGVRVLELMALRCSPSDVEDHDYGRREGDMNVEGQDK